MEKTKKISIIHKLKSYLLKEKRFLSSKKEVNWIFLKQSLIVGICLTVVVLLALPETKSDNKEFYSQTSDKIEPIKNTQSSSDENNPSLDTWNQMKQSQSTASSALKSVDAYSGYLSGGSTYSGRSSHQEKNYNSNMILSRNGGDANTSLPAGTSLKILIQNSVTVSDVQMPVIGTVTQDVLHGSVLAIPSGSKIYGRASFDESTEKAQIVWESIAMSDSRSRQIQALAVTNDGQSGVYGSVKSNTYKNITGHMITRFVGAYAEGSIERSVLGVSTGGAENGLKQAISETAKDQAEQWGNDLKKEKKWVEISANTKSEAIITTPFQFKDVGVTY